jgi:formylglycine-generating enzyme required for sulfatase activity
MNLTSQYIVNPKSRKAYFNSEASYKSIRTTNTRLRLHDDRQILNLKEKDVFRVGKVKFKMIRCPIGQFKMGDENILTKIERPFLLGETEVTQELFQLIMGYNPSEFQGKNYPNSKQRPVEQVTWYDAVVFCNKLSEKLRKKPYYNISKEKHIKAKVNNKNKTLPNIGTADITINPQANGFRLPDEKEWVYAAKAGTNNQWAGTNDEGKLDEVAWYFDNSNKQTHPVKGKRKNEWGFYDMTGNVLEWCGDLEASKLPKGVSIGGYYCGLKGHQHFNHTLQYPPPYSEYLKSSVGFRIASMLVN